jgi:hypothetical protein
MKIRIDYLKLFGQLEELIPQLRTGKISRIIYGEKDDESRMFHYHQLSIQNTPAGPQFAFHLLYPSGQRGSGDYIGRPQDDKEIIDKSQFWIQYAHRDTLSPAARRWLEEEQKNRPRAAPEYFGAL